MAFRYSATQVNLLFIDLQECNNNKLMSSFATPYAPTVGLAFWVGGLVLSPLSSFFMRSYSPTLVIVQLLYVFGNVYAADSTLFAANLGHSWLGFVPSMLTYCPAQSTYECTNASLITVLLVWAALAILVSIIVKVAAIKRANASFKPFYDFWRGVLRWTIIPLVYNSFNMFIYSLQEQNYHRDYYGAITVLIFYGVVLVVELIGYKCCEAEEDNGWSKWAQFLSQLRVGVVVLLISLSNMSTARAKYALYAPILLYDVFHLAKYNFTFKVFERVVFCLQEAVLVTVYSLFIFDGPALKQYSLDFVAAAVVIILELFHLFTRVYSYCKLKGASGAVKNEDVETPEINQRTVSKERSTKVSTLVKQNSFIGLDDSLAELKDSASSPRRRGRGRLI